MRAFGETWRPKKRYASEAQILSRFSLRPEEPCPPLALAHMAKHSAVQDGDAWVWKFDEQITRLFKERRFAAGETVTKEGSGGAAFFLIFLAAGTAGR